MSIIYTRTIPVDKAHKPVEALLDFERANPFSNTVLIGNWFEERFANKVDRKAIAPAIYGESKCYEGKSLYKDTFLHPIPLGARAEYDEFVRWRQLGFSNRLSTERTNIQLRDDEQFDDNLTTLNDIVFRIKPKEEAKAVGTSLRKKSMDFDYMRSYGNSTKTGVLFWLACEKKRRNDNPADVSHYKNHFKANKITQRIVLHKGPQRKTCIT